MNKNSRQKVKSSFIFEFAVSKVGYKRLTIRTKDFFKIFNSNERKPRPLKFVTARVLVLNLSLKWKTIYNFYHFRPTIVDV